MGPEGERQPSDREVRTAIWEACGDSGALQLLVDLLNWKWVFLDNPITINLLLYFILEQEYWISHAYSFFLVLFYIFIFQSYY